MKRLLLLALALASCSQQSANEQQSYASQTVIDLPTLKESTLQDSTTEVRVPSRTQVPKGNRIFVDKVHVFDNTQEPYVWVGLKKGYNWRALDTLKRHCDSVLYVAGDEYDEIRRSRFPMEKAKKYLDLELLDGITLFNYNHQKVGKTTIKRVEYYEDVLGAQFVAVLELDGELIGDDFYGINGTENFVSNLSNQLIPAPQIKADIRSLLGAQPEHEWDFESVHIEPYGLTYTFYSFLIGLGEKSYLFESIGKKTVLMTEITNDYSIFALTPVCLQINEKPVLLLWIGLPETDAEWYSPAYFNGSAFEITNNRIFQYDDRISRILDQKSNFKLEGFSASIDASSSDIDTMKCSDWKLSMDQIDEIIKHAEPITGSEWHDLFGHFPCSYRGTLYQNGHEFQVEINSGSWLTITSDTTIYYGDIKGKHSEWFHASAWKEDSQ